MKEKSFTKEKRKTNERSKRCPTNWSYESLTNHNCYNFNELKSDRRIPNKSDNCEREEGSAKTLDGINIERQSDRQRKVRKLRLNRSSSSSSSSATKSFIVHEFFCIWPPPPFTQISTRKTFQKPSRQHQVKNFLEIFQFLAKKKL